MRRFCDHCWTMQPECNLTWTEASDEHGSITLHACRDRLDCQVHIERHALDWIALRESGRIKQREIRDASK